MSAAGGGVAPAGMPVRSMGRSGKKGIVLFLKRKYIAIALAGVLSAGCANTNMSKEMQLTAGGAVAGAVVGAQAGGVRGAVIGGVIGGVVGNRIGAYLDEEDKKKLALLESQSLQSGKPASFVTGKSKAKVTITPQEAKEESNPERTFNVPPDIVKQRIELASHEAVSAFVDTPLYRDTNEKKAPRAIVKRGEKLQVAAGVINKDGWGVVADGDNVLGYVPLRYLDKSILKQPPKTLAKAAPPAPKAAKPAAPAAAQPAVPAAAPIAAVAEASSPMQAARVCKVNLIRIDPPDGGSAVTEERKYCKEPPKGWKVIA